MSKLNGSHLLGFSLVGIAGFIVDAGVLLLVAGALGPYGGRLVSFALAVLTTWVLNRNFTFRTRESGLPLSREFGQYFSAMIAGGASNYALYAVLITNVDVVAQFPTIGVAVGSIAGLAINFLLAKNWIFRAKR